MQKEIDAFNADFLKSVETAKSIGLTPNRIIAELDSGMSPFDLAVLLMKESAKTGRPQAGFKKLMDAGRLDITIEALILSPKHQQLFSTTPELIQIRQLADIRIKTKGQF
jgi:hypothetical protein